MSHDRGWWGECKSLRPFNLTTVTLLLHSLNRCWFVTMPLMQYAWLIWCGVGYLCGSVSFALILGRLQGVDIRKVGSGNVGATNVGRVLGKKWGIFCFLLDVLKGAGPTLAAGIALGYVGNGGGVGERGLSSAQSWQWLAVGAAAMMGHIFPVWLKFKGGKGVATGFGVLLGVWPYLTAAGLSGLVLWILMAGMFRYVGLASVVAAMSLPGFLWFWAVIGEHNVAALLPFFVVTSSMGLMVLIRHRGNLARTWRGTEPKLGKSKPLPSDALSQRLDADETPATEGNSQSSDSDV